LESSLVINYGGPQLAAAFRTVRKNTLQIAEDIPADKYDFVPAPGTRPVGTLLVHIAYSPRLYDDMHRVNRVTTLAGYNFGTFMGWIAGEEKIVRPKEEIVALLKTEGDTLSAWLESLPMDFLAETFTDPSGQNVRTRFESLLSPKEHEMHHRGQLMTMQRMIGQVPHLTRQMQERMAAMAASTQAQP
jgi:uncharacterized damage-inducible protein DinB